MLVPTSIALVVVFLRSFKKWSYCECMSLSVPPYTHSKQQHVKQQAKYEGLREVFTLLDFGRGNDVSNVHNMPN